MGSGDNTELLHVSAIPNNPTPPDRLRSRYFSLFITYTPYTIYKCEWVLEAVVFD